MNAVSSSSSPKQASLVAASSGGNEKKQLTDGELDAFFREVQMVSPVVYYAENVPSFNNFLIIMDDVTHAGFKCLSDEQGAPSSGEVMDILDAIAAVHANYFGRETELQRALPPGAGFGVPASLYSPTWVSEVPKFWKSHVVPTLIKQEGVRGVSESHDFKYLEKIIQFMCSGPKDKFLAIVEYLRKQEVRKTLCHGDFRLDNVAHRQADASVKFIDWQLATIGSPAVDMAFFLAWTANSAKSTGVSMEAYQGTVLKNHFDSFHKYLKLMQKKTTAAEEASLTWEDYILQFSLTSVLLIANFTLIHRLPGKANTIVPAMRKSLINIMKEHNVHEVLQRFFKLQ